MAKRKQPWQLTMEDYETLYPKAGDIVDGYKVRDDVPNMDSIYSSMDTPTIVKGIREVSMKEFRGYKPKFYSVDEKKRTLGLAKELKESKEVAPLIVVYDSEGAYILEGGHRFDALKLNKAKSFPAKVVFDEDSIYDSVKEAMAQGKRVPEEVLREYGREKEGTWAGKKPWEMTKDEYNKHRGVVYHQTSKENAQKIEQEGFKLDYPVARRGDDRMPDAVFFKPTTADIGVGGIDDDMAQVDAYVKKGKVKEFNTIEKLQDYLEQDPQYKELYYQSWLDDRKIAKEMNKLSDEYFGGERKHKSLEEIEEFDSKFSALKEQAYIAPTKARERATAYLKEQGVDTVIVKDDVGSFGRRVTTIAALDPKKTKPYLHKQVIREAMKRGKSVPDSVLKDYADLYEGKKRGTWASEYKGLPSILEPLAKEAHKYKSSDDYQAAFLGDINHGIWFHVTDNPKFTVSKEIVPKDYSSMSPGGGGTKGLMVTGDLDAIAVNMKGRDYVAVLDLSEVPPKYIKQVSRGFGNEMFLPVEILDKVKVSRVIKKKSAVAYANRYQDALEDNIHSGEDLKKIYDQVVVPVKYAPLSLQRSARPHKKVKGHSAKVGRVR